jgi:hypothetical protein
MAKAKESKPREQIRWRVSLITKTPARFIDFAPDRASASIRKQLVTTHIDAACLSKKDINRVSYQEKPAGSRSALRPEAETHPQARSAEFSILCAELTLADYAGTRDIGGQTTSSSCMNGPSGMLDRSLKAEFESYRKTLRTEGARRAFDERIERLLSQHGVDYVRGYVDALKDFSHEA